MASSLIRKMLTQTRCSFSSSALLTAARKGTRERKKAKIVKKVETKTEWVPASVLRAELLNQQPRADRRFDGSRVPEPIDDVYKRNWFRWPELRLVEAVAMHRETHHPTIYNRPEELVFVTIELDMQLDKRTRFADNFHRVVTLPHPFEYTAPRELVVFCQSTPLRELAASLGVAVVGGSEIIKQFQAGTLLVDDFSYFVAHPEVMQELLLLRGLLRRRFPNVKDGSLSAELAPTVLRFRNGLEYASERDERQPDFAQVIVPVGRLHQPLPDIASNLTALLVDIEAVKPRNHSRDFVTRVSTWCKPVPEKLDIQFRPMLQTEAVAGKPELEGNKLEGNL